MGAVDNLDKFNISSLKQRVEALVSDVEKKTEAELRNLHADALVLESDIKKEITILRQRAANLATDADTEAEEAVIEAKALLGKTIAWLENVAGKIENEL
jgi:hypothetical protein